MLNKIAADIAQLAEELDESGHTDLANKLDRVLESVATRPSLLPVPDIRQFNTYSCGSACLLAVLTYWGLYKGNEKRLGKILGTNAETGTNPKSIVEVARKFGLDAELRTDCTLDDIRAALDSEEPVIANFQAWSESKDTDWKSDWDDGHYAVVVGIDDRNLYFRDPTIYNKIGVISRSEFEDRWHDMDGDGKKYRRMAIFLSGDRPEADDEFEPID